MSQESDKLMTNKKVWMKKVNVIAICFVTGFVLKAQWEQVSSESPFVISHDFAKSPSVMIAQLFYSSNPIFFAGI